MTTNIITEKTISFNELEKEIFEAACMEACRYTKELLEGYDDILAGKREKKKYRNKGKRTTCIKTIYGEVSYERRVYETRSETGSKMYVYLLDKAMGMEKIGHISTNLGEKIAEAIVEMPYRIAAEQISSTCGQSISHGGIWDFVQKLGNRLKEEEDEAVKEMNQDKSHGQRGIPVLFEEMDGLWLKMQGKHGKKAEGQEMKVSTVYEGWDADRPNRLVGKTVIASMEESSRFLEKREAGICRKYDVCKIEQRILNGDGGSWIKDPYDERTIEQLDRFHVVKEIKAKITDGGYEKKLRKFLEEEKIEELIEGVQIYADSVANDNEEDTREEKALELKRYLENHKEKLSHYDRRGLKIPEAPKGIVYKHMGVQENQNATVIAMRMKHGRKRWSRNGADHMAKLLCSHENNELTNAIRKYTDGQISERATEEIKVLSAWKSPKADGKGKNPYIERFGCHLPVLDSSNAGTVRMLRGLIG